jgi:predicted ABC-type exoprotein transport system permease subunit
MLWAVVLWMKPWQRLTWASARKFILWPVLWLLVSAAGMPLFFNLDTTGYPVQMPLTTILIAVGLNLIVLSWLLLLLHGKSWLTRPRALRWLTPVLALLMTTGVFYLFVAYQPNGPLIVDKCLVKYDWCKSEFEEWAVRHNIPIHGEAEAVQDK